MMAQLLVTCAVRMSLVLAPALVAAVLLRRAPAAARHAVLAAAVCGALAVPVAWAVLPAWHVSVLPATPATNGAESPATAGVETRTTFSVPATPATEVPEAARATVALVATWAWAAGSAMSGLMLLAGLWRLRVLSSGATPLTGGTWPRELQRLADAPRVRRTRLLMSDHPGVLFTSGLLSPRVVLPRGADAWSDARIRIVLAHELEHIRRGDWPLQVLAQVLRAVAWFNPLAWAVTERLRLESERACDDAVVAGGVDAAEYADHLVGVARTIGPQHVALPAPAMARPSSLERRVRAMLDPRINRHPSTRFARNSLLVLGLACAASIATFAQSEFATLTGTLHDQHGGTIPGVTLTLTHAQSGAKHEVRSNDAGAYEFVGLRPGNYALRAGAAGFKSLDMTLQLAAGRPLRQDATLELGTLQETITVRDGPPAAARPVTRAGAPPDSASTCSAQPNSGRIKPPMKIEDRRPVYPASMRGSDIEGRVRLNATIAADGAVRAMSTVEATNPDFELAAQEAVRRWRFTSTLLNCVPVEVEMAVLAVFRPEAAAPPPPPPPLPPPPPQPPVR